MSKFTDFIASNKIDPRRLMNASRRIERLRPEDRKLRLLKRDLRKGDGTDEQKEAAKGKPRSGRPVTRQLLAKVESGKPVTAAAKQRLLRAVNHVLEQKKKDAVDLSALF